MPCSLTNLKVPGSNIEAGPSVSEQQKLKPEAAVDLLPFLFTLASMIRYIYYGRTTQVFSPAAQLGADGQLDSWRMYILKIFEIPRYRYGMVALRDSTLHFTSYQPTQSMGVNARDSHWTLSCT